jgi:hypothetical protein
VKVLNQHYSAELCRLCNQIAAFCRIPSQLLAIHELEKRLPATCNRRVSLSHA